MVDQTKDRISEVQTSNQARNYETKTVDLFEEWIKKCPVKIVGRSDVIHGKNAENGLVTLEFYKKRRK